MKNGFRKLLATLCALVLLLTGLSAVLAEEETNLPETGEQPGQVETGEQPAGDGEDGAENGAENLPEITGQTEAAPEEETTAPEGTDPESKPAEAEDQLPGSGLPSESEEGAKQEEKPASQEVEIASEPVQLEAEPKVDDVTKQEEPAEEPKEEPKQEEPVEEPKEEPKQEEPVEEPKEEPKQEEPVEEPKEESKQEEPVEEPVEEPKQEESAEESEEEPKQDQEPAEEENLLEVEGKDLRDTLNPDQEYIAKLADKYSRNIIITLTIKSTGNQIPESGIKVWFEGRQAELTRIENEDTDSTDIICQFEARSSKEETLTIKLLSEYEAEFILKATRKPKEEAAEEPIEEPAEEEPAETSEEPAETSEEENKEPEEQTKIEENETNPDEEKVPEEPETVSETPDEQAKEEQTEVEDMASETETIETEKHISVSLSWDEENPTYGSVAHLKATLTGYEGLEYTMQWQWSLDRETWYDIENATSENLDVVYTEENGDYHWRIMVDVIPPAGN